MRKRIVIGLLAVVVIGVVAFFVSQPKKGSVEWHKREYLAACQRPGKWFEFVPGFVRKTWGKRQGARQVFHWQALREIGYLTEGVFVVTNGSSWSVANAVQRRASWLGRSYSDFVWVAADTNVVLVGAPSEAMSKLGEWIREADVR